MELSAQLEEKESRMVMRKVLFLPGEDQSQRKQENECRSGQGRLVTLSGPEQVLHFWEVDESRIERVKTTVLDCIPSAITALTVDVSRNVLFLGSSAGTVHQLHLWSFILDKEVISKEQLLANVPEEHQEDPGEVVQVAMNPFLDDQVMVAFSQGFMMLWSTDSRSCLNILKSSQQLQGVCWRSEDEFFSAQDDGSFTVWDAGDDYDYDYDYHCVGFRERSPDPGGSHSLWALPMPSYTGALLQGGGGDAVVHFQVKRGAVQKTVRVCIS